MNAALVLQDQPETLTLLTSGDQVQTGVKVSFFGGLTIGRVADPDYTLDQVALVASPPDLLATKLKELLQRVERKNYLDVATLLDSGLALSDGLASAQALYGSGFPVRECLKALVYFADGDLAELGNSEKRRLEQAVMAVDGIPSLKRIGKGAGAIAALKCLQISPRSLPDPPPRPGTAPRQQPSEGVTYDTYALSTSWVSSR